MDETLIKDLVCFAPFNAPTTPEQKKYIRDTIQGIQDELLALPGAKPGNQDDCPVTHKFGEKLYIREQFIPSGMVLIGRIHKYENPFFVLKGSLTIITEEGRFEVKAPYWGITKPGTKRMGITQEDTIFITVHNNPDNLRDIDALEDIHFTYTYEDYGKFLEENNTLLLSGGGR